MALRKNRRPRVKDLISEAYQRTQEAQGTISRADQVLIKAEVVLDRLVDMLDDIDEHGVEARAKIGERVVPISVVLGVFADDE